MIFNFRDVELYYEIYGEGIPIIMIHGCRPDHRLMKGCTLTTVLMLRPEAFCIILENSIFLQ